MSKTLRRKEDHLRLCNEEPVGFRSKSTLLEEVELIHSSMPELSLSEISLSQNLLGKSLRLPILIASMTGGTEEATHINRRLAALAEKMGIGLGLGSQSPMLDDAQPSASRKASFAVRDQAPTALIVGNIGLMRARELPTSSIARLIEEVEADALFVHLNPAQELIQPEGDRDFRSGFQTLERLMKELPCEVIPKETGAGISFSLASRFAAMGVRTIDVSGAGGTSWVGVESMRAAREQNHAQEREWGQRELGELLWDWGIPTAATTSYAVKAGLQTIATGGIKNGLDVARAIALGATVCGIARPILQALLQHGEEGAQNFVNKIERELRSVMLLVGAKDLNELRRAPRLLGPNLQAWLNA